MTILDPVPERRIAGPRGGTIRLRALEAPDLRRVVVLEQQLFGRGAWSYGMLAEELGGPGRWYVAAEPEPLDAPGPQEIVGYAGLWFDGDVTQIMTIGVDPAAQHQGVGTLLLDALVERSRVLRASAVLLEVAVTNDAALAMYAKHGFEQMGLRRRYYQPGNVDAYTMRLELRETPGPVGAEAVE
ncbi:ribosomal-protein-alanine N-acetyltransferase [Paraoerskovia marina]|uniref:Ribosomal-protein-alanine N-acetyltransferase n=1 Tax=Paraoerskovia marina TaxID=545619 RepID=A0A1H1V841_9CELL|nr:ribosomal protein S18-alanine N-acetyltransferase [Paraoerskovia marina]SDS80439.1 ribosomal-protein-alanine N-acetyltransferase [Paraoerskovia marina]